MRKSVLLNGFMATGKSSVGRHLARSARVPFVDLDEEVERRFGASVRQIFESRGEAEFRKLEGEVLRQLVADQTLRVIAVGGGALLRRERRLWAMDHCVVVTLEASVAELVRRASGSPRSRPLLQGGDLQERIEQLLEARAPAYAECHLRVTTTDVSFAEIVERIEGVWVKDPIGVAAGEQSYRVDVGSGFSRGGLQGDFQGASRALVVTDKNVGPLHLDTVLQGLPADLAVDTVVLEPGEAHKTLHSAEAIWEHASRVGADRSTVFVGLGGGVVTDTAGFAAASWMRGVPWIGLPTTLLSMVDASVGGKTAVDLGRAKNCVGAFWQPRHVVCDVELLRTEPARGNSALSEVVKTALIGDEELFALLEREADAVLARDSEVLASVLRRCVRVKARVVGQDAREAGVRAHLNLGHTIGHALEAVSGFDRLSHGEAVSLGLVASLRLGERWGVTPAEVSNRTIALLERLGLPTDLRGEPLEQAVALLGLDKKRKGSSIRFITVSQVGAVAMQDLALDELGAATLALA